MIVSRNTWGTGQQTSDACRQIPKMFDFGQSSLIYVCLLCILYRAKLKSLANWYIVLDAKKLPCKRTSGLIFVPFFHVFFSLLHETKQFSYRR